MTGKSSRQGKPSARAQAALDDLRRRLDEKKENLEMFWDLADQVRELEATFGAAAARVHEDGQSLSDMANTSGMHPNRLRRLIDRHDPATGD